MLNKDYYKEKNIILTKNKIIFIQNGKKKEKKLNLDLYQVRNQLKQIGFYKPYTNTTYNEYYSENLEHFGIPYMNYIYYLAFFRNLQIPTFNDFFSVYIETYCEKLKNGMYRIKQELNDEEFQFTKKQLIGRVFRSYNSFHREIDLFFQLIQEKDFEITYDFQNDLNGIDLTVTYKNKTFGIASYVATKKSNQWKQIKNTERHQYEIKMMDIVAKMHGKDINCDCINGIYLYSRSVVKNKIQDIKLS